MCLAIMDSSVKKVTSHLLMMWIRIQLLYPFMEHRYIITNQISGVSNKNIIMCTHSWCWRSMNSKYATPLSEFIFTKLTIGKCVKMELHTFIWFNQCQQMNYSHKTSCKKINQNHIWLVVDRSYGGWWHYQYMANGILKTAITIE